MTISSPQIKPASPRRERLSQPSDIWRRRLLIGLVVTYVALLILAPIVSLISGAFKEGPSGMFTALREPDVFKSFSLTLYIALITVVIHALFGTTLAWVLVRQRFWGRNILNAFIDLPFAVSSVVVGYMLLLVFGRGGMLAPLLEKLDIKVAFAVPGMILATLFVTLPFMVRELIPVLEAFGIEQEQAAATLGASGWQTFWLVTFPALRWGFIYGVILTFARSLGEFGAVLVVGGGIQGHTETATLYIYRALDQRQYVGAYSAALVLGLLSLILVVGTEMIRKKEK